MLFVNSPQCYLTTREFCGDCLKLKFKLLKSLDFSEHDKCTFRGGLLYLLPQTGVLISLGLLVINCLATTLNCLPNVFLNSICSLKNTGKCSPNRQINEIPPYYIEKFVLLTAAKLSFESLLVSW